MLLVTCFYVYCKPDCVYRENDPLNLIMKLCMRWAKHSMFKEGQIIYYI